MAIDRLKPQTPVEGLVEQDEQGLEIEIENPDSVSIETEDGGMIIDFDPEGDKQGAYAGFYENLAEYIDDDVLQSIGSELCSAFDADNRKRSSEVSSFANKLLPPSTNSPISTLTSLRYPSNGAGTIWR